MQIIEFTDFLCPACARGTQILDEYISKYPNEIYLAYHYYPITSLHPNALPAAIYAECAAKQDKFWPFHDKVVAQAQMIHTSKGNAVYEKLLQIGDEIGLDRQELESCVSHPKTELMVIEDKEFGTSKGIQATPTYFLNDKMVVGHFALREELSIYFNESSQKENEESQENAKNASKP